MVRLKVFGTDRMPPGIRLKRPILIAAPNIHAAALGLHVSVYHLSTHPMPQICDADRLRALATPGLIIKAGGSE